MRDIEPLVVIPFSSDDPARRGLLDIVVQRWRSLGFQVAVTSHPQTGLWCKGRAIWDAYRECTPADVLIVADADVLTHPRKVHDAVATVGATGGHEWAMPTTWVTRLNELGNRSALAVGLDAAVDIQPNPELVERKYRQHPGGGLVVIRSDTYERIPMDPRFLGWGQEDDAWGRALYTLAGAPWRGHGNLLHLWHTPSVMPGTITGRRESIELFERYQHVKHDRAGMLALVAEAREQLR